MRGHEAIIEMRKRGERPAIAFLLAECGEVRSVGDVSIGRDDRRPDLRFLVGLDVLLIADDWSAWVGELWDRVKLAKPAFAQLAVTSWGEDLGLKWKQGKQDTPIGEDWNA